MEVSDEKDGWKWEGYISSAGKILLHIAVLFTFPFRMTVIFLLDSLFIKSLLLFCEEGDD